MQHGMEVYKVSARCCRRRKEAMLELNYSLYLLHNIRTLLKVLRRRCKASFLDVHVISES